jgi:hypothetical protein
MIKKKESVFIRVYQLLKTTFHLPYVDELTAGRDASGFAFSMTIFYWYSIIKVKTTNPICHTERSEVSRPNPPTISFFDGQKKKESVFIRVYRWL